MNEISTNNIDINNLTWKNKNGVEIRLMDMSESELQRAYDHTNDMLYNTNRHTPGKLQVKKNIKKLINDCNAELLMRYILHECEIDILKTNLQLINYIRTTKSENHLTDTDNVTNLFKNFPAEFETVTIEDLLSACFDKLDIINRKMLSDNFILSQGIWLTEEEKEELTEFDENGKQIPWLNVIKERLIMDPRVKLRVDPKGFTYAEFRALMHLDPLSKISKLPTVTLRLLRDKVLLLLDEDVNYHISKWENIKNQIEKVAEYKQIKLTQKTYA